MITDPKCPFCGADISYSCYEVEVAALKKELQAKSECMEGALSDCHELITQDAARKFSMQQLVKKSEGDREELAALKALVKGAKWLARGIANAPLNKAGYGKIIITPEDRERAQKFLIIAAQDSMNRTQEILKEVE